MRKYFSFFPVALCIVTLLAGILRMYNLSSVPPSLNADEVANGYNAYSILKTGKDEYNRKLPLLFQSFDDYKLPVNIYFTVPSIAVFGLNDFAVRFPSALFGTLTVLLTYFLVKELFVNRHKTVSRGQTEEDNAHCSLSYVTYLPLLSAALLAISPWHLQFSRCAHEGSIAVFFTVLGITCLLRASKYKWLFIIGFISLALSMWSYHSSRVLTPLILISYSILYYRDILKNRLYFLSGTFVCFILCIPLLLFSFSSIGLVRARGVSALDDPSLVKRNVSWRQADIDARIPYSNIFHNHRLVNISIIIKGYLDHYNPNFFFSEIVQEKYHAPGVGLMYLWELPFLLYGIFMLLKTKSNEPGTKLLFCWFLFAPIAASFTHALPHPGRTLIFLPTLQIFTAFGILSVINWTINNKQETGGNEQGTKSNFVYLFLLIVLISSSTVYYLHQYYIHMPIDYALNWQYGHEQVVEKVTLLQNKFDKVVVSTSLDQPYIFFLYYLRYDPATYLSFGGTKSGKFDEERNVFGKYEFHSYMKSDSIADANTLYVGTTSEMLPGTKRLLDIRDPSGNIVYGLYDKIMYEK